MGFIRASSRVYVIGVLAGLGSLLSLTGEASSTAQLPVYDKEAVRFSGDWLIETPERGAAVYRTENPGELVLSNGLISRTFRLAPNAATVGFDNLMNDEALLRGVKPEARISIDGVSYDIGGLKGQPNYAFLRPEWVDDLTADPFALQFEGFEIGEPQERMAWKRVRHHAPDVQWPPKGVYLRMDYRMPDPHTLPDAGDSATGRALLLEDTFDSLDSAWQIHTSSSHPRSSFENEGKPGEIYTPANTAVFAERPFPEGARLVELTLDAGTDNSASWGPGIALVWPEGTVKFNLRPGGDLSVFGVYDGVRENPEAGGQRQVSLERPCTLRLRFEEDTLYCEVKTYRQPWLTLEEVQLPEGLGAPRAVRIGKMDARGGTSEHSDPGDLVRLRVMRFAAYSAQEEGAVAQTADSASPEDTGPALRVSVHYELYDGVPLLSKWLTVHNEGSESVRLDTFTTEILAAVERGSDVEATHISQLRPNIHVESDYAMHGFTSMGSSRFAVHWVPDPEYSTQVNYQRLTPCLLEVRPEIGPAVDIDPGETFESFRAFVMPFDSYDRERNGLAQRRMYRTLAPWVTENPLMMHVRHANWEAVKLAIDQCAEVGFEMVIMTFGSGFNIENDSQEYLAEMKRYVEYARERGIEIGGYSLLASRRIDDANDVVMPEGQRPTFGNSPCLQSEWGIDYFRKLYQFYETTGMRLLEHDGSYPGDVCMSTQHPGHRGLEDSRWTQWRKISDFYKWCRGEGIYLNVPDYYYLSGSNKCGMGYREVNWSLPRAHQVIHTRQNIYDGSWEKTPSMGWMFVPLTEYHGGGAAATIEPLDEHLDHYERMLISNLAMGVQACYRGPRLYDTDRTREMVTRWVAWFKEYRDILESDLIHGRRADGRDIDWMLHVNPNLERKGMLVVFNPLEEPVERSIRPNLYYTGLTEKALVAESDDNPIEYRLNRDYTIEVPITIPPQGFKWFVITAP